MIDAEVGLEGGTQMSTGAPGSLEALDDESGGRGIDLVDMIIARRSDSVLLPPTLEAASADAGQHSDEDIT